MNALRVCLPALAAAFLVTSALADAPAWPAPTQALVPDAKERAALSKREILVSTHKVQGSSVPRVVARATIAAPPAKVWAIVSDCSRYASTMPRIKESKQLKKDGDDITCRVVADMPFPLSDLVNISQAHHSQVDGVYKREWKLVEGDYKTNTGKWVVAPLNAEGTASLVLYELHADPNIPVPQFVLSGAQEKTLPSVMERLRKQVE